MSSCFQRSRDLAEILRQILALLAAQAAQALAQAEQLLREGDDVRDHLTNLPLTCCGRRRHPLRASEQAGRQVDDRRKDTCVGALREGKQNSRRRGLAADMDVLKQPVDRGPQLRIGELVLGVPLTEPHARASVKRLKVNGYQPADPAGHDVLCASAQLVRENP
jgi:hypothetical protein